MSQNLTQPAEVDLILNEEKHEDVGLMVGATLISKTPLSGSSHNGWGGSLSPYRAAYIASHDFAHP